MNKERYMADNDRIEELICDYIKQDIWWLKEDAKANKWVDPEDKKLVKALKRVHNFYAEPQ